MKILIAQVLFLMNILTAECYEDVKEYNFINIKTEIKNPYEVRDPFKRKSVSKKATINKKEQSKGVFVTTQESIENKNIESIKVIGIMIGKERRALARVAGATDTFIIKEGMRLGQNGAEVKAILPGGIVLAEKIKNIYDQDEYLETVLPVSGD